MRLSKKTLTILGLTAIIVIACIAAYGRGWAQQPSADGSTPTLKVSTRLAVVDVMVTDANGKPVRGLTQADFTLKENGQPQPLRSFQEYGTETPSTQPATPQLPPNVYTNQQPPSPTTSAVNLLLVDSLNTPPANQMNVKQQSMSYLKNMPAGTRVAILELRNRLRVVQGFTSDRAVLLAAMDSIGTTKALGDVQHPSIISTGTTQSDDTASDGMSMEMPNWPAATDSTFAPVVIGGTSTSNQWCQLVNTRSQTTLDALNQTAAFVSGIKGRKNLIWFTTGLPQVTAFNALHNGPLNTQCLGDYTPELHKTYGLLTAAQVAVYPVSSRGVFTNPSDSPEAENVRHNPEVAPPELGQMQSFNASTAYERDSLLNVAEITGGVAYYNRNDLGAAIGEAIATGNDYYTLSYTPPNSVYDGKYHTIEVKVERPGVHLTYRKGYTAVDITKPARAGVKTASATAPQPQDRQFLAAMGHGAPSATQLLFIVQAAPSTVPAKPSDPAVMGLPDPTLKGKSLVRYDLHYVLYPDQITVADDSSGAHKASVRFDAAAYDAQGKRLNVLTQTANVVLKPEEVPRFAKAPFRFTQQLDLPPGKIFLRVGILDNTSDKDGTLEIPVTVTQ